MLQRWINKKKLLLGQVVILDRKGYETKNSVADFFSGKEKNEAWLRQIVQNVVELKSVGDEGSELANAVGVDVIFARHQLGDVSSLHADDVWLPILWRPQLHVVFRIFNIKCGSTIESFEYKRKMSWVRCLKRLLALKLISPFEIQDLEPLFISSYIDFLKDAKRQGFV